MVIFKKYIQEIKRNFFQFKKKVLTYKKICCNIMQNKGREKIFHAIFLSKIERRNNIKKQKTTKEWLPFDKILENGIIINKNKYIKIIKIIPINYDLKSNLEKEAILNSYKLFLKTCDFNIQILVQSKKENLSKHFSNLKEVFQKEENEKIKEISEKYIDFIKRKNEENKSSSKNFYMIIKYSVENNEKSIEEKNINENIAINYLNESFFKVKETLSRCGNIVYDINSKQESEKILNSFFNPN
jgi:hypothetical protein